MTRPIPIPPEVVEAARDAIFNDKGMEGIIQAALAAWPGAERYSYPVYRVIPATAKSGTRVEVHSLILPLPPEGGEG